MNKQGLIYLMVISVLTVILGIISTSEIEATFKENPSNPQVNKQDSVIEFVSSNSLSK